MADTQTALLRRQAADYRLALALARLEALVGDTLAAATAVDTHGARP